MPPMFGEPEPTDIELRDYLRVLRQRKMVIALVVIVIVGAAVGVSLLQTRLYQSRANVLIQRRSTEALFSSGGGQANSAQSIQTQIQLVKSDPVQAAVKKKIGAAPGVSALPVGQTDVMQIKAISADPTKAATIANAYANAYIEFKRNQALEDFQAAANQLQPKISDLQKQIDD